MTDIVQSMLRDALRLSATDRAALAEGIVESLDVQLSETDVLWLEEARQRMSAYRQGKLKARDAEEVFSALRRTPTS